MKQLRKILFSSIAFATCLFISPAFIKAELSCSSTLKNGSSGTEVKTLQTTLNELMNCSLTVDGKFGSGTESCVKKYQEKKGLAVDGKVGPATCSKLNTDYSNSQKEETIVEGSLSCTSTLKNGSSGTEVKTLQTALNKIMGCGLTVDGKFGSGTESCVLKYQEKKGLSVDGKVGPATCSKINTDYKAGNKVEEVDNTSEINLNCRKSLKRAKNDPSGVKKLQIMLNKVMSCGLTVDGSFGSGTESCVKKYQNKKGLVADGSVGIDTATKLNVDYAADNNYIIVNSTSANVRPTASTAYDEIGTTKYGTVYKVYGTTKDSGGSTWYKIKYNDSYAYIYNSNVTKDAIVVNLSEQILHMYKNGKLVLEAPVITGNVSEGHSTPTGRFVMYTSNKFLGATLTDHKTYWSWVDYWMPFNGGIGFHDSEYHVDEFREGKNKYHGWRSVDEFYNIDTYKTDGSHGCINMLHSHAKSLYNLITYNINVYVVK